MSEIHTEYLERCIQTLEKAHLMLKQSKENSIDYDLFRSALIKTFEITLEQSGKLLKKKITPFFATKKAADSLSFKDIFRYAHQYSFLTEEETKRWLKYRDNRNNTAHDYGEIFAKETLILMEDFLKDVKTLKRVVDED